MFGLKSSSALLVQNNTICKQLAATIADQIRHLGELYTIPKNSQLYTLEEDKNQICLIRGGVILAKHQNEELFHYDELDFVGIEEVEDEETFSLLTVEPTAVELFSTEALYQELERNDALWENWQKYLEHRRLLLLAILSESAEPVINYRPEIVSFKAGETIISQNAPSNTIYMLAKGEAKAEHLGTELGVIEQDELFGHVGVFANCPRTATVKAVTDCEVLELKKEDFFDLMQTKPETVEKLVYSMARALYDANTKIASNKTV